MNELLELENTLMELYEHGLVTFKIDDDGEVRWELTPIAAEGLRAESP